MAIGKIKRISGSVVDVEFKEDDIPKIREGLRTEANGKMRVMEVAQHIDSKTVRCIMLSESEGLSRDMRVEAMGTSIQVPVGEATLGRVFNVLGESIDVVRQYLLMHRITVYTEMHHPLRSRALQ